MYRAICTYGKVTTKKTKERSLDRKNLDQMCKGLS